MVTLQIYRVIKMVNLLHPNINRPGIISSTVLKRICFFCENSYFFNEHKTPKYEIIRPVKKKRLTTPRKSKLKFFFIHYFLWIKFIFFIIYSLDHSFTCKLIRSVLIKGENIVTKIKLRTYFINSLCVGFSFFLYLFYFQLRF